MTKLHICFDLERMSADALYENQIEAAKKLTKLIENGHWTKLKSKNKPIKTTKLQSHISASILTINLVYNKILPIE